ncbi:MAG: hypothetical protein Q7U59_12525 [Lutibacter sp.]|nr:hypothetical protein [Lutibacter sp.]
MLSKNYTVKNLLLLIFLLNSILGFSQSKNLTDSIKEPYLKTFPVYKGCEKDRDKQLCFSRKISLHFSKHLRPENFQEIIKDYKTKKIYIEFNINKEGIIDSVKINSTHKSMEIEAKRVVNLIPRCIPGKLNNEPINVKYSLPIAIKIENKKNSATRKTPWNQNNKRNY